MAWIRTAPKEVAAGGVRKAAVGTPAPISSYGAR